ncbi:beta-1,4-mannosyl-glycoprotein 4-beta-N-acetylglucosaminyltransferase [Anopheles nili]|uniref:beta-1,4-mannosyl-glycoprotein 4-beta-N-acetylglucosaminyltransferase n=1 Tax=Anopheles nili TaxID=185578 RepID=UPI00237C4AE6|nr:beta-1,4-mannosyl-glycoprotein 4-beta-N-acetylglucosaminyltransferase [Anopheles nili]
MSPVAKRKLDVRLLLWGLFLLQISLICLFGSLLVSTATETEEVIDGQPETAEPQQLVAGGEVHRIAASLSAWSPFGVRFIPNRTAEAARGHRQAAAISNVANSITPEGEIAYHAPVRGKHYGASGQLLKNKLLHPRHPKYQPWIQRKVAKPERADKYFKTILYSDWQGNRKRQLCFIEGTQVVATKEKQLESDSIGNNETELIHTGMEGRVPAVDIGTLSKAKELNNGNGPALGTVYAVGDESMVMIGEDGTGRCRCNPQWHGADCGQPEVVWRAFITSKIPPRDQPASARAVARNIFYIVQSTFVSVEVLEIQLMELADQVNLFVLCDRTTEAVETNGASIGHHVEETDFLRSLRDRVLVVTDPTCSGRNVFRKLQKYTAKGAIKADDIVLLSSTDEILNRKAVAYLRWYDNWPQPVRFRLKHNVYGFFWQHPDNNTVIGSAAVQVGTLREVYGSDPDRLLAIEKPVMLIGDLNHFGGWYCRRCYQPGSIVQYFEYRAAAGRAADPVYLPDPKRTKVLNEEYVQQLIAAGKDFEDRERPLDRLSRRTDKYYMPDYVRDNGWKFDNIVLNLFARWEDNLAEDDYFS